MDCYVLCIIILTKEYIAKVFTCPIIKNTVCIFILLCSFWGIYNLVKRVMAEKEWGNTSRLALCGASGKTLPAYAELEKKFEIILIFFITMQPYFWKINNMRRV